MIIDFHAHIYPPAFKEFGRVPPVLFDLDSLERRLRQSGVAASVITNPLIMLGHDTRRLTDLEPLQRWNDFAAEQNDRRPGRFRFFAAANPWGGDEYLRETERALGELGLPGVGVLSSLDGQWLDAPSAQQFFALVDNYRVPVFVHPPAYPIGSEHMVEWRLTESAGRPFDTALSLARLVMAGVLAKLPDLIIVGAHMAGALVPIVGRLDAAWESRFQPGFDEWGRDLLPEPPSTYVRKLYADSMGFHGPAVRAIIDTLGPEHVLFGTDFPPVDIPYERSLASIRGLGLSEETEDLILGGNAQRLLRWQP